jgi:transposase
MSNKSIATIPTMGIDIGKNSFHVVGLDQRGAIVLRQKWSRGQIEARIANMPPCLIGMEACVGAQWCRCRQEELIQFFLVASRLARRAATAFR